MPGTPGPRTPPGSLVGLAQSLAGDNIHKLQRNLRQVRRALATAEASANTHIKAETARANSAQNRANQKSKSNLLKSLNIVKRLVHNKGLSQYSPVLNAVKTFAALPKNSRNLSSKASNIVKEINKVDPYIEFSPANRAAMANKLVRSRNWTKLSFANKKRIISALGTTTTSNQKKSFQNLVNLVKLYSNKHACGLRNGAISTLPRLTRWGARAIGAIRC